MTLSKRHSGLTLFGTCHILLSSQADRRVECVTMITMAHVNTQLFFSTHDVIISGWRLRVFLRSFREGKVAAVKTGNTRYVNLCHDAPFVAEIKIAPVKTLE